MNDIGEITILVKRVLDRVSCNESDIVNVLQFSFSLNHFFYYVFVLQQGHGLESSRFC